ncbi:MAG: J domain-containing protein [Thaumarchaeota archaeon]|nr:J domain-containing protein [Nitrososphaerota archaeon]
MSNSDDEKTYYETLGLPPDATMDQVKSRYRELNDAYLEILQLSKGATKAGVPGRPASAGDDDVRPKSQQGASPKQDPSHPQETRTEPIARTKARLAKGEIQKAQFEKLAKERYNYLKNKSFTDLSDSEFEERLHGFEGLKFL